jgi:hypothetical protein
MALRRGLSFRHSVGPGEAARWVGRLAVVFGLAAFVYAIFFGGDSLGGYGAASACLAGFLVWAVLNQVAAKCPRARLLSCGACGWRREAAPV